MSAPCLFSLVAHCGLLSFGGLYSTFRHGESREAGSFQLFQFALCSVIKVCDTFSNLVSPSSSDEKPEVVKMACVVYSIEGLPDQQYIKKYPTPGMVILAL